MRKVVNEKSSKCEKLSVKITSSYVYRCAPMPWAKLKMQGDPGIAFVLPPYTTCLKTQTNSRPASRSEVDKIKFLAVLLVT